MIQAICYLEGKSDRLGLESLLREMRDQKSARGVEIQFFEVGQGDRKKELVTSIPKRSVSILRNNPWAQVAVVPDLYPPNKGFPHQTFPELEAGIRQRFDEASGSDLRLASRFHVFCFKYDFEVLLLAAENYLPHGSTNRYEELNHDLPPKRRLEQLLERRGQTYNPAKDAPEILSRISYGELADRCPEAFKPFVLWLEGLGDLDAPGR